MYLLILVILNGRFLFKKMYIGKFEKYFEKSAASASLPKRMSTTRVGWLVQIPPQQ